MRIARIALVAVLTTGLALTGCADEEGGPEGGSGGTSRPVGPEALGDDEVTLHLLEAPPLPDALDGAQVTTSELRAPDLTERHTVEVVDVPADVTGLDGALGGGALLRVGEGARVEIGAEVGMAALLAADDAAGELGELTSSCAAPCVVEGPALVAPPAWMTGIGAEPGWLLLVPSPLD